VTQSPLLQVKNLHVCFWHKAQKIAVIKGVSFEVNVGETLAIVGESGCGKTTMLQAIGGLLPPSCVTGSILFQGAHLHTHPQEMLGKKIGMVFQDPFTALNPTMKIGKQITEGLLFHRIASRLEAKQKALQLLHCMAIPDAPLRIQQYPHELSGGQKQRVAIAIALACSPSLLLLDEPTTALDPDTKTIVCSLLQKLQQELLTSMIWISHDLPLVTQMAHRRLVLHKGQVVLPC
jgi:oligopeptide transport system ATP-binding protein